MTVTVFVFFMECQFDVLQALPWQVEGLTLALVTDVYCLACFYAGSISTQFLNGMIQQFFEYLFDALCITIFQPFIDGT